MQTLTFVLALGLMLVCPALAGNSDNGRPGIGTYAYNGSPIAISQSMVVAAR